MAAQDRDLLAGRRIPDAGGLVSRRRDDARPSGLKAAEVTKRRWPRRTAISLPVAASQMRAVLSADAVTMREPSGLKAAEFTHVVVAAQDRDLLGGRGVPDAGGLVA